MPSRPSLFNEFANCHADAAVWKARFRAWKAEQREFRRRQREFERAQRKAARPRRPLYLVWVLFWTGVALWLLFGAPESHDLLLRALSLMLEVTNTVFLALRDVFARLLGAMQ